MGESDNKTCAGASRVIVQCSSRVPSDCVHNAIARRKHTIDGTLALQHLQSHLTLLQPNIPLGRLIGCRTERLARVAQKVLAKIVRLELPCRFERQTVQPQEMRMLRGSGHFFIMARVSYGLLY